MKRFFMFGLLSLATAQSGLAQQNTFTWPGTHMYVVPNDPPPSIDALNFVVTPGATFGVDLTAGELQSTFPFTTANTLNVTNYGRLVGVPGFDFGYYPNPQPQPQPGVPYSNLAGTFANIGNGIGGGAIYCTNIYFGLDVFALLGSQGTVVPGLATLRIAATNVIDSGLISMDNTGLIDIKGNDLDLRHGQFLMFNEPSLLFNGILNGFFSGSFGGGSFGLSSIDYGLRTGNDTNLTAWDPAADLQPTTAISSQFLSDANGGFEQMELNNATPYFETTQVATNLIIWRGIYLQDSSPPTVTNHVYFGQSDLDSGQGSFHIEWAGTYRDPATGGIATNYFYLSDEPALDKTTNTLFYVSYPPPRTPSDFSFNEQSTPAVFLNPAATSSFTNPAPPGQFTNDFSYVSLRPTAAPVDTNIVFGGSVTNLPGRIQLKASHSLNLANTHISGPNYLSLTCTNDFLGNTNAIIVSPYTDLNLGVTSGVLSLSNLLLPTIAAWTGVPDAPSAVPGTAMAGLQAWSASFIFVDTNNVTNDVRILLVNSALQPTAPTFEQNVNLHATQSLTISDALTVFGTFTSDTTSLTVTTNATSAYNIGGGMINLLSPAIFWSTSLPNLQFLTNDNVISTVNLAVFAGNFSNPYSDPNSATPYQAFVNNGVITNQGTIIRTAFFQNDGSIVENNGGTIDIGTTTAIVTNGSFIAPLGDVSLSANSLLASNSVIDAGGALTLAAPCFISDGYVFGNEFGHITNAVLPNVVTNGNSWKVNGGVRVTTQPATGDLLGTTIFDNAVSNLNSINIWSAADRGVSPSGFAQNLAVGRLILNADNSGSQFTFQGANGNNALYVDSIELQGNTTNLDANGNPLAIAIAPGMKIYYAQAIEAGQSIAEKLNGKYGAGYLGGGQFFWVSNYAGVYSSTNISYPDGNTYIFNDALAVSPDIDSDGDGVVNRNDATPISIGTVFDITNDGPQSCDGGTDGGGGGAGGGAGSAGGAAIQPGVLSFPVETASSDPISFALAQGSYNGLFYETNGVKPATSGFFTATVTAKGGLTAKLELGGHTYSFSKPPFDTSGHFTGLISAKGVANSLTVDLQLVNNDEITGQVSGNGWTAQLLAQRAAFSTKHKTALWTGTTTLLFASEATNSTTVVGDGVGTATITASGAVQWSGALPDGTKVSQKSALDKDGTWPLYYSAYGGAGSFMGWMHCTNKSDIVGSGVWIVPAKALYPQGLTNQLDVTGSSAPGFVATHFLTAIINGGSLQTSITNGVQITGKTAKSTDGALKLSLNLKTGLFTGSMKDPDTGKALSFQGALMEESGVGGGFFLNSDKTQGGELSLAPAN